MRALATGAAAAGGSALRTLPSPLERPPRRGLQTPYVDPDHILIVEDEPGIAESLRFMLERDHFRVEHVETLAGARAALAGGRIALVILDLGLPDGNGEDLLRELRRGDERVPLSVIVLTSRDSEIDRIVGLELGADDYVTKPFSPREVVARVRAVLRRTVGTPGVETSSGLRIDADRRRVTFGEEVIELTRTEHDLLATLCARPGVVFTRDLLLDRVWHEVTVTDRTVDAHIKSLRKKLRAAGADAELIETVRGIGYRARE